MKEYLARISIFVRQLFKKEEGSRLVREYTGEDTIVAAISYVPFVCAAVLVLRRENSEFVSFHARQALVILLITALLLLLTPDFLKWLVAIAGSTLLIFGTYRALQGRKWYFPVVTELANTIEL